MSWRDGAGKCQPSEQTLALMDKKNAEARNAVIEECAKVLDEAAQDWNRICDPGMANNARSYAKKIRALAHTRPHRQAPASGGTSE